jgi:hemerythrin-like domain-containing protein
MLKTIGTGAEVTDMEKLSKTISLFHDLCSYHIECEEAMIYPEAKAAMNYLQAKEGTS